MLGILRYFFPYLALIFFVLLGVWGLTNDFSLVVVTALLVLLEVSLSFDNAVVNAKVLVGMPPIWQRRFLTWGMLIAVFGVRFIFPLAMVSLTGPLSMTDVFHLALHAPDLYRQALNACLPVIAAFGGGFLLMVSAEFFLESSFEYYWIKPLEKCFEYFARLPAKVVVFMVLSSFIFYLLGYSAQINQAFMLGLLTQYGMHQLNHYLNSKIGSGSKALSSGLIGFIYLELLDASFSFDGVVGAFALTDQLWIIMLGLGLGAFFVRSITIYLMDHQVLGNMKYLEYGAHYSILTLAFMLIVKISSHPSEWLVGGLSAGFIVASLAHSLLEPLFKRNISQS